MVLSTECNPFLHVTLLLPILRNSFSATFTARSLFRGSPIALPVRPVATQSRSSLLQMSKRRKLGKSAEPAASTVGAASESPIPTICVLGATGVGKGSTLNSCFRTDRFGTSGQLDSDTVRPVSFVLPWRGNGALMRAVDLCGFSDSEGRDTGFIEAMVDYLRTEVESVNCFLLLLNSQEPRIGMHLKDMLVALRSVFGLPFLSHVIIGFTRWDDSTKGVPYDHMRIAY